MSWIIRKLDPQPTPGRSLKVGLMTEHSDFYAASWYDVPDMLRSELSQKVLAISEKVSFCPLGKPGDIVAGHCIESIRLEEIGGIYYWVIKGVK